MKKHILVVDDDTLLTEMVSRCLTTKGYTVTTTNSGEEAFSFLAVHFFDLILCDIHMDGKYGFAILAACKTMHPKTKVILCSGDVVYKTISMAFKCGAESFLAKPFLTNELRHQVSRCLGPEQHESPRKMPIQAQATKVVGREGCFA